MDFSQLAPQNLIVQMHQLLPVLGILDFAFVFALLVERHLSSLFVLVAVLAEDVEMRVAFVLLFEFEDCCREVKLFGEEDAGLGGTYTGHYSGTAILFLELRM